MNTCDELLATEVLFLNVLEPLNPPEIAALLSAFVFQVPLPPPPLSLSSYLPLDLFDVYLPVCLHNMALSLSLSLTSHSFSAFVFVFVCL